MIVQVRSHSPDSGSFQSQNLRGKGMVEYRTYEFVLPSFGKLVKQKRKARTGFNPKTQQKIRISAKTVLKFRVAKVAKDTVLGVKK